MFLIMSAAYVGQELQSEFGKIPPSFLPLGNRRLFQHQVALAPKGVDVFLSIPEGFDISKTDEQWLNNNKVTLLKTPEGVNLGASLVTALNISGYSLDTPLHILYGDTLFKELPEGDNIASISSEKGSYNWATITSNMVGWVQDNEQNKRSSDKTIIDGYFKFNKPRQLIKNIIQSNWDFIKGLNLYHQSIGLSFMLSNGWLDFGHVNTYYSSKAEYTTQRAFNELVITSNWVEKSSFKTDKISAEAQWFSSLPYALRGYIPQYMGTINRSEKIAYRLEYMHLTALNELFVFAKLPTSIWRKILNNCIDFLIDCRNITNKSGFNDNTIDNLFINKTKQRLGEFCADKDIGLDDFWNYEENISVSIRMILDESEKNLPKSSSFHSILHGDYCFSNILYDFRAGKVKVIDPRGLSPSGEKTIYGDLYYDIAKLSHSILGLYDWIIAGYYDLNICLKEKYINFEITEGYSLEETQQTFIELIEEKFKLNKCNLYAMQIQLFLSMLPLHEDDPNRQNALLANSFRLYNILVRLKK